MLNTAVIEGMCSQRASLKLAGERLRICHYILRLAMCLSFPICSACFLSCQGTDQSLCLGLRHKEPKYIFTYLDTPDALAFWILNMATVCGKRLSNSSELYISPL